ncbi:MAG: nitrilase family protein [Paludibacteraceae bacterium]|nr:nitrilase family protein [Paludibacteraceae bacterium]
MRFALLQYPIVWADKAANLGLLHDRLEQIAGKADVAVLPEMFSTGFCTDRPDLAEPWGGDTCCRLQAMADSFHIAIAGSMICVEGNRLFNRGFLFRPIQSPLYQDKRHLYRRSGEDRFFHAGQEQMVWEYQGVRMRMLVCYDLRFPVWARQPRERRDMYDVLLCVANWPQVRIQYWDAMLASRATENQCYIVAVNPVGDDGMGLHYNGHSVAYDTRLVDLAAFRDDEEGTRIVELDMQVLQHFRDASPLWKDADQFELK